MSWLSTAHPKLPSASSVPGFARSVSERPVTSQAGHGPRTNLYRENGESTCMPRRVAGCLSEDKTSVSPVGTDSRAGLSTAKRGPYSQHTASLNLVLRSSIPDHITAYRVVSYPVSVPGTAHRVRRLLATCAGPFQAHHCHDPPGAQLPPTPLHQRQFR
eukprot:2601325-Rhodomonas_salina.1